MKWAEVLRSFGPTISSKNKIIKILILKNNLLYFYPCFGLMSKILNLNSFLLIEIKHYVQLLSMVKINSQKRLLISSIKYIYIYIYRLKKLNSYKIKKQKKFIRKMSG